nr:MAG TPA: hypothetical protein [Caudoviricetes sp.]DAG25400.1 MAG TPA: hypothetical protein [Bacteriophage sp.]DAG77384.1 MAG TPA: hypothetical protein [Caudoviricetes sp.]
MGLTIARTGKASKACRLKREKPFPPFPASITRPQSPLRSWQNVTTNLSQQQAKRLPRAKT